MRIEQEIPQQPAWELIINTPDAETRLSDYLEESYRPPTGAFIRGNIVLSKNGSLTDNQGVSAGISSPLDRQILRLIRQYAEVVIHGASTLRAEGLIVPKNAQLAILTATGVLNLPSHPLGTERILIFCAERAYHRCVSEYRDMVAGIFSVPNTLSEAATSLVQQLWVQGYQSLVCEGGAQVLDAFLKQQLIDEMAVTRSPVLSQALVTLQQWPAPDYHLLQRFSSSDRFQFERWRNPNSLTKLLYANTGATS